MDNSSRDEEPPLSDVIVKALEAHPAKTTALPPINGPLKYMQSMM